ncbi:MAG: hypothetical protein ACOX7E_06535 [Paludibacter sp.]|jgi:hypothetical protein
MEKQINAKKTIYILMLSAIVVVMFGGGCMLTKTSSVKSKETLYETFYVNDTISQYFIRPLNFKNKLTHQSFHIDFVFRVANNNSNDNQTSIVTANFSVLSNAPVDVNTLQIENAPGFVTTTTCDLLFQEKQNKKFFSRYTAKIQLGKLQHLMYDNDWKIKLNNDNSLIFYPVKRTQIAIKDLNNELFENLRVVGD